MALKNPFADSFLSVYSVLMSSALLWAFFSVVGVSLVSLVGVFALGIREGLLRKTVFVLVSLATGALFGDALFHLIPEALEEVGEGAMVLVVLGILAFFILEKALHWHHHHTGLAETEHPEIEDCPPGEHAHQSPRHLARLVLVSDSLHNLIDGVVIGASYMVSIELGLATTLAVILHEIPQEIGDFGVLLHAGLSKAKALLFNFFSALFAIAGALLAFLLPSSADLVPFIVAFAAGHFIYIAGSDLVPELHKTKEASRSALQFIALVAGFALMYALLFLE